MWGARRIHGELLKLGIHVSERTVSRGMPRARRTFLTNHVHDLASIDFFTIPAAPFRVCFVLIVVSHARRRVLHVNVTEHPTAAWTAQPIVEAFPWKTVPRDLLRDRDGVSGSAFRQRVAALGIPEVPTAPHAP